ncbi:MAG: type I DNA topoisomerase [Thermodesulfobacteriota bacterium]
MGKSLVIVESPAKAKTINKLLGNNFKVMSSIGHVKDLPKSKLGVDVENDFTPEYEVIKAKKKTLSELKKAGKSADKIYLASDPDREGEAIAWHIAEEVDKERKKTHRVLFNEITKKAVLEAIEHTTELNHDKFDAQQARRVLDRLVGYQVSPILWDKVRRGLSAGRVQSVAVRLVCERERAISAFKPKEYWSLMALFNDPSFMAKLAKSGSKKIEINNEKEVKKICADLENESYTITKIERKERKRNPLAPFITSRLQQEASRKLSFTAKKTMMLAQQLYEGIEIAKEGPVGLITYMRTDSTRISEDAIKDVRAFIEEKYGLDYLPEKPNFYKNKKGAQDAHEAIRPTYFRFPPESVKSYLNRDQFRLYTLIWNRTVASQMKPAILDQTKALINAGDYIFNATGSIMKFQGHTIVYTEGTDIGDVQEKEGLLPELQEGQTLKLEKLDPKQHFTQPPPRFSEATLVKELEENGIGRPSTYAATLSTIVDREYTEKKERQFYATELGFVVTDLLVESFPEIFNVEFTARMEEELDQIAEGKAKWVKTLKEFYGPFSKSLKKAKTGMKNLKTEAVQTDIECEKCKKLMIIKWGRNGKFLACPGYPECKNTADFETKEDGTIVMKERVDEVMGDCPNCGKPMIKKTGRFGRFLACTGYPECKTTKPFSLGIKCSNEGCDGSLVERRTKKGRTFYGCSNYPKCDFATWKLPKKEEGDEESGPKEAGTDESKEAKNDTDS